jgi:hypothetical protein
MIAMFSWIGSVVGRDVRLYVWCAEARASSRTRNACKETQKIVYEGGRGCGVSEVVGALGRRSAAAIFS